MANVINLNCSHGAPSFKVTSVLEKKLLNYASIGENSNKYYKIELQEGVGDFPYRIYTEYGRVGKNPRKEGRYYKSYSSAFSDFHKIVSQKEGKGYKEVLIDDSTLSSQVKINTKTKVPKEDLTQVKDKVLRFIGKLYQNATSYLVKSIETPLGKLSATQVAKGFETLQKIEDLLDRGVKDSREYERYSNEFYSIIPVIFGNKVDPKKFLIDDYVKLNDRKDLLGVMSSVVQAQSTLEKTLEEKYKALKIELRALSHRSKEFKRLVEKVKNTRGHNHHFDFDVQEIYEVVSMVNHDKFNPYKVETMELFHGTRNENILSIMQSGLKIKPKSAVHTGSMFGAGIYFADCSTKSAQYCWGWGTDNGNANDEYYLFVCEVATGRIKEYTHAQPHLVSAPRPYNSVKGVKGASLLHNEYIVYRESQVKIRYIIEFKKVPVTHRKMA